MSYSDRGWSILRFGWLRHPPELFAAMIYVMTLLVLVAFCVLVSSIFYRLFGASWRGNADELSKLLLGFAGLLGSPFLVWRVLIASKQNQIAQDAAHTTLFSKAIEQLGATRDFRNASLTVEVEEGSKVQKVSGYEPNLEMRLGAIYALEKLARDYQPLRTPIIETLCAYVRNNAVQGEPISVADKNCYAYRLGSAHSDARRLKATRVDIQAAITVLGRREKSSLHAERDILDFSGADLSRYVFNGLNYDFANFRSTWLEGSSFESASVRGADFRHIQGQGANFDLIEANEARFNYSELQAASFCRANLLSTEFQFASLDSAYFRGSTMSKAVMTYASACLANFQNCIMVDAELVESDLSGSNLLGAALVNASLEHAELKFCRLTDANCSGGRFLEANMSYAEITGASFNGAQDLTIDQLDSAFDIRKEAIRPADEAFDLSTLSWHRKRSSWERTFRLSNGERDIPDA